MVLLLTAGLVSTKAVEKARTLAVKLFLKTGVVKGLILKKKWAEFLLSWLAINVGLKTPLITVVIFIFIFYFGFWKFNNLNQGIGERRRIMGYFYQHLGISELGHGSLLHVEWAFCFLNPIKHSGQMNVIGFFPLIKAQSPSSKLVFFA